MDGRVASAPRSRPAVRKEFPCSRSWLQSTLRSRPWNRQKRFDEIPWWVEQQNGGHQSVEFTARTEGVYAVEVDAGLKADS
jgi:hypothetical protein